MKKTITLMLIGLMLNAVFYVSSANGAVVPDNSAKQAKMIAKLKVDLQKIGVGEESKIEVKLNDGTKISGYLSEINEEDFVVKSQNDDPQKVRYDTVRKAKGRHRHRDFAYSTGLLGVLLGVLVIVLSSNSNNSRY